MLLLPAAFALLTSGDAYRAGRVHHRPAVDVTSLQLELEQLRQANSHLRRENEQLRRSRRGEEGGWSGEVTQHQSPPPPPVAMEDLRASKPNILIVFGDDVGYADLNCFGHPTARTPNLDKMAAEGAKLVQYLSAANICSPSRGSLLTGRLYGRLGIWPGTFPPSAVGGLQTNETTIARALQRVGYTSGMVGKWHLGQEEFLPFHHGFDFYYGVPMTQNTCVSNIDTPGSVLSTNNSANPYGSRVGPCPILRDATVEEQLNLPSHDLLDMVDIDHRYDMAAASFIRNATDAQTPWFFYFSSHHTHVPQFAPEELTGFSVRGLMGDSLSVLDRSVGRLLNLTKSLGIDERTMVLFSADNGGARYWGPDVGGVNGELRCGKETTYEGGHRVPTIIRWVGKVQPSTVNTKLFSSLDWFPTIGFLAGYDLSTNVKYDGVDISAALFADEPSPRRTFFYHSTDETLHFQSNVANETGGLPVDPSKPDMPLLMAVRKDQWKLHMFTRGAHALRPAVGRSDWAYPDWACTEPLKNHSSAPVLFDLHKDPGETVPRTPCPGWDGKWPISGNGKHPPSNWHSGCMTTEDYQQVVSELTALYYEHVKSFPLVVSQIWRGSEPSRFPCCNPGCTPLPECCHCGTAARHAFATSLGV